MSDITLTAGIRQNLLSLQQTSADLTTTQEALATGKAVNSAADNPSAYFTSQNLTNTANSLSALLDQIGQGQQTINAATNGLTGITSLLQQALSTVQQAQQASQNAATITGSVSVGSGTVGTAATGTLNILVGTTTYGVSVTAGETSTQIEAAINATTGLSGTNGALTASDSSGDIVLTANSNSTSFTVIANATSNAIGLTSGATSPADNNLAWANSTTRGTLQTNYNGLLTQINELANDAAYNGVNLLTGNNLQIDFNSSGSSSLTIDGVTDNFAGLNLATISGTASGSFQDNTALSTAVTNINNAITQVQTQTETFGTNSGVIGTRQTFETNMINTLQTGASNLVVADQNEESADLLTEQTQQQLEISALSIANQANQSVLKLFS
jgi:flagellin-like hook-associated protein FlgL